MRCSLRRQGGGFAGRHLALALLCAASACGALDTVDHVTDLRMLAMRAEPPEQIFTAADVAGGAALLPVQLTALVADPNGGGRPIAWRLVTCASLDPNSQRCVPGLPGFAEVATGTSTAPLGWVEVTLPPFKASAALLAAVAAADNFAGIDGLRLPLQLTLQAGDSEVVGNKLVVYRQARPDVPFVANANPRIDGLAVAGQPWDAATEWSFSRSTQPKDGWDIEPMFDANGQVPYQAIGYTGRPIALVEAWVFDFFSTFGGFVTASTGGFAQLATAAAPTPTQWQPTADQAPGAGLFWVVVRDGRGGTDWLVRRGTFGP